MPRITGADRVEARLAGGLDHAAIERVGQALYAGGEMIRAEAAHLITENAVSGKHHVPSAPGDPPNEDTGDLRIHIETIPVAPLRVEVTSSSGHALPLEVGTSKMAPRPYMTPATEHKRREVVDLVGGAVSSALKPTAE